jgi:molecular chaperone DnaK (HSP70)
MNTNNMPRLGIDFGTCRSSAAVLIGDNLKSVNLGYDTALDMPTAVYVEPNGHILVGDEAVNARKRDNTRFFDRFKPRIAGRGVTLTVHGERRSYEWPELVAAVLTRIRTAAEAQFNNGQPITNLVLTVPALYSRNGPPWMVMEEAARLAKFTECHIVREPHAAAMYYDYIMREARVESDGVGKITLVYDLGGGTFDPALIRRSASGYQIIGGIDAEEGVKCGGIFFDKKIRDNILLKCPGARERLQPVPTTEDGAILPEDAERARQLARNLADLDQFVLAVKHRFASPDVSEVNEPDPVTGQHDYTLTRREFYGFISSNLDETIDCCRMLVERHGKKWPDIARILMVGGCCRIPLVREKLEALVRDSGGKAEICWGRVGQTDGMIDPLLAVSLGAALATELTAAPQATSANETEAVVLERSKSILELGRSALAVVQPLAERDEALTEAIRRGTKRVATAQEPFRLGVVGDARAGKSTLINALAGERLAFTDVIEATPVMCRFGDGAESGATIHYRDDSVECVSVEEANQRISDHRHDADWIARVRHVEFVGTHGGLRGIELWDAPGFGGSDHNDATAAEFLGRIGGAIWVFDCQFLGVATHILPLEALKQAGKKVIAVVNKIDYLDSGDVDLALDEVKERYDDYAVATAPLSAFQALQRVLRGESDPHLENVRSLVQQNILNSSEGDRKRRINAAAEQAGREIAREIAKLLRTLNDRLGFLKHIRETFGLARRRIVALVPELIKNESETAYSALERRSLDELSRFYTDRSSDGVRVADVGKLLNDLYEDSAFERGYQTAAERIGNELRARWDRECLDAVQLTAAAIPNVSLGTPRNEGQDVEKQRTGDAMRHGGLVGSLSAVLLTTVVVATTVAAWPLILATVPISAFAAWRKYVRGAPPTVESVEVHETKIKSFFADRRRELRELLMKNLPAKLEELLDREIQAIETSWTARILGAATEETVRSTASDLSALLRQLQQKLPRHDLDDRLQARPLVIESGHEGFQLWRALLSQIESRVHIVVPNLETPLIGLLRELRPEVEVRVIASAARGHPPDAATAFGAWQGKLSALMVAMADGSRVPLRSSLVISEGAAFETEGSLGLVGEKSCQFRDYPDGLLAAERFFAELWEGKSSQFGAISVKPMSRAAAIGS